MKYGLYLKGNKFLFFIKKIKMCYLLNKVRISYSVTIAVIIHAFHTRKVHDNEKAVRVITFDAFSFVQPTRFSQNILFFFHMCC